MKGYHPRITKSFVDRADGAAYWEAWVAGKLSRMGYDVLHPALKIAGKEDKMSDFYGSSDLVIGRASPTGVDDQMSAFFEKCSLEVKSANKTTAELSVYARRLVCSKNAWVRKFGEQQGETRHVPIGYAFVFVSSDGDCLVLTPGTQVGVREVFDKSRYEKYQCMDCDSSQLVTIENWAEAHLGWDKEKLR